MQVIGIGLCKSGTTTLAHELNRRGIRTLHGPYPQRLAAVDFGAQMNECAKFDAMVEWIGLWKTKAVLDRFPEAILINTPRGYDEWLDSCRRHFLPSPSERVRQGRMIRFGVGRFVEPDFSELYWSHMNEVARIAASGRKVYNLHVTSGDGLSHLDAILSPSKGQFQHKRKGRK